MLYCNLKIIVIVTLLEKINLLYFHHMYIHHTHLRPGTRKKHSGTFCNGIVVLVSVHQFHSLFNLLVIKIVYLRLTNKVSQP